MMWCWARRWFQPTGLRLSWRGVMLEIARWPVVLWALVNVLLGIRRTYMITPKGVGRPGGPRLTSIYGPYLLLAIVPIAALSGRVLAGDTAVPHGYYGLVMLNGLFGAVLLVTTLLIELRSISTIRSPGWAAIREQVPIVGAVVSLLLLLGFSMTLAWHPLLAAL
jgi:cellulose synthase (UDP-forming)